MSRSDLQKSMDTNAAPQAVRLRALPAGSVSQGWIRQRSGARLDMELAAGGDDFVPGAPLEIVGPETIFLGIVAARQSTRLSVLLEHQIDVLRLGRYGVPSGIRTEK